MNPALLIPKPSLGPQDHHSCSADDHLGAGVVDVNHCGALTAALELSFAL